MTTNKAYFKELISILRQHPLPEKAVNRLKMDLCKKYNVRDIPTNIQIFLNADEKDLPKLKYLQVKPTRTISGVSVVALMTKPYPCPHAKKSLKVRKLESLKEKKPSALSSCQAVRPSNFKAVGPCIFCPGGPNSEFGDVPQSYTGREPSTMRGIRNKFDSYLETMNRLEQYVVLGHNFDKIELIIMGGTFTAMPKKYCEEFILYAFKALNDFSGMFFDKKGKFKLIEFKAFFLLPGDIGDEERTKAIQKKLLVLKKNGRPSLKAEQRKNENAKIRCVGLTIETRPDCVSLKDANEMLRLGATRVELGVQTVYDDVLKKINRGHTTKESIAATKLLKDLGFKINYHMMPGLPGVNYLKDLNSLKTLFKDENYRPDMLKIYPCMVMKGTKLYEEWKQGRFKPITTESAARLIAEFKKYVPTYVRIMRVQRDIPTYLTEAGVDRTNLRQYVEKLMSEKKSENGSKKGIRCRCIRCREVGHVFKKYEKIPKKIKLIVKEYSASKGKEFFISFEDVEQDILLGFCRLRFPSESLRQYKSLKKSNPSKQLRKEITKDSALIRELHVFGEAVEIGKNSELTEVTAQHMPTQHKGLGKKLLEKAESIAKTQGKNKMIVISAIGTREYYKRSGYKLEGVYMVKKL
ncbi:tRNA uridine(34) 5-carboxymethylaminomethyl modification radical SAM/GNAT enzyme Elp3 [Candidatus Woesearchaeota archaeon]|nr:tRNA uridine(34) 5-carboxymethylaminomethyl modification radical SAM/GNAT enzyme Elp3 [Candidatus Woesearchaeota archaeon]